MTQTAKTCSLILNWNRWQLTLECLDSLSQMHCLPSTLLVCDNSSDDDSSERILGWGARHFPASEILCCDSLVRLKTKIHQRRPSFVVIQSPENLGFAGGNNLGLHWALAQECFDFMWLLNNDTTVDHKSLASLLACAEKSPDVGLWGSTICWQDSPEIVQCAGGCQYFPLTTVFQPILAGANVAELQDAQPERFDYILGASLFVRSEVFQQIGLLNEDYFLFYEEIDFCRRAVKAGYSLDWCRSSLVYHQGSASIGAAGGADRQQLQRTAYHENLSTLKFTRNHHAWLLPVVLVFRFVGKAFFLIKRRQFVLFPPLLRAYRDFFRSLGRPPKKKNC